MYMERARLTSHLSRLLTRRAVHFHPVNSTSLLATPWNRLSGLEAETHQEFSKLYRGRNIHGSSECVSPTFRHSHFR
jgi:hypothetical protein